MAVRERNGKWQVDVSYKGERLYDTKDTREDAEVRELELLHQLKSGNTDATVKVGKRGSWTFATAADYTLRHHWEGMACHAKVSMTVKELKKYFGERTKLDAIDYERIDDLISHLKGKGNSNSTINKKLSCVSKILRTALQRGKSSRDMRLPRLKETEGRIRWLTYAEEDKFLAMLHQIGRLDEHDAFIVLTDTGLRPGELWVMAGTQVDVKTRRMTIWADQNKTGKTRTIIMTDRVRDIIAKRKKVFGDGALFPGMNNWLFRSTFAKVKTLLGMDNDDQLVPYTLRHTCCSRLVQLGANFYHVKEWMGHTTIVTTQRYTHLAPKNMEGLATLLNSRPDEEVTEITA